MMINQATRLLFGYLLPVPLLLMMMLGRMETVMGYGTGAPQDACWDMRPNHGVPAQVMDNCPYEIEFIGRTSHFSPGKPLTVVITGAEYQGFLLQAQDEMGNPLGSFSAAPEGTKYLSCSHGNDSFTHSSPDPKTDVQVKWTSPIDYKGYVLFKAAVAKNKMTFWEDIIADLEDDTKQQQVAKAGGDSVGNYCRVPLVAILISMAVLTSARW